MIIINFCYFIFSNGLFKFIWSHYNFLIIKNYLFDTATLSNSSFFLKAYEFGDSFAAFISSSAKHSAIVFILRKAASRAPKKIKYFTYKKMLAIKKNYLCIKAK